MKKVVLVTHDGTFHTDDVFACAALSLMFHDREIEIIRSRDERDITRGDIVFDVGGVYDPSNGRFDHHQKGGAGTRDSGIPYASFGLVWKEYGHVIAGSVENAQFIDEQLVQCIDAHDNGVEVGENKVRVYAVGDIISSLRPTWQEETSLMNAFLEAVTLAQTILVRIITHAKSYSDAQTIIEDAYNAATDKRIIELLTDYPGWNEALQKYDEPLYIVYERSSGGWTVKAIRKNSEGFDLRKPFPEAWAGHRDIDLAQITGVPDAQFCHNNRFIAVARTREGAWALAKSAVES